MTVFLEKKLKNAILLSISTTTKMTVAKMGKKVLRLQEERHV